MKKNNNAKTAIIAAVFIVSFFILGAFMASGASVTIRDGKITATDIYSNSITSNNINSDILCLYDYSGCSNVASLGTGGSSLWANINGNTTLMSGNVGIGTTSPTAKLMIQQSSDSVSGGLSVLSQDGVSRAIWVGARNDGTARIESGMTGAGDLTLNSGGGNVGIGTTTPTSTLHLKRSGNVVDLKLEGASHTARIGTDGAGSIIGTTTNGYLLLSTNDAERMRIDSSGNVGIGTTNPLVKFVVQTTASLDGFVLTNGTTFTRLFSGTYATGGYNSLVQTGDNGIIFSNGSIDGGTFVIGPHSSGAAGIRMLGNGNVGIGTASPSEKLEVSGNIKLSGAGPTYKITNVAPPTLATDVATKSYVDAASSGPGGWTCVLRMGGTVSQMGISSAGCLSPEKVITGGCLSGGTLFYNFPFDQGWYCASSNANSQAYANCCK